MDCFGTYFTHVQTCDYVCVQSATEWAASVHTSHMSKPVITFVFKVLRNGLLRYILQTCPNLWCFGFQKRKIQCFLTAFITKFIVSPLGNANFALGVMALPHRIDAHEHQGFSKTPQIPHFSFQALIQNQKYAYAQGRRISQLPCFCNVMLVFRGVIRHLWSCSTVCTWYLLAIGTAYH